MHEKINAIYQKIKEMKYQHQNGNKLNTFIYFFKLVMIKCLNQIRKTLNHGIIKLIY